jgi:very-short-patch-repair endonuclease
MTVHLPRRLAAADIVRMGPIPVTTPARTLIDLAGVVSADALEEALDDALRRRIVTIPKLDERVAAAGAVKGVKVLRALIADRGPAPPAESVLETRLVRLLKRAGMSPVLQYPVRKGARVVGVIDLAFPNARVGVEADGYRWHSGRTRWQRDLRRRNELTALGWRIVHVTWTDLHEHPRAVLEVIEDAVRLASDA